MNADHAAEFYTDHSKLTIKGERIIEKVIIEKPRNYWFHSFILDCAFMAYGIYGIIHGEKGSLYFIVMGLVYGYDHFKKIYHELFVVAWRKNYSLREIKSGSLNDDYNDLEDKVTLTLKSGRKKIYIFRKSEGTAEAFKTMIEQCVSKGKKIELVND
jgi:hypothetical protein